MNTQRTILAQLIIARDNLEKVLGNLEELSGEEWDNLPFDYYGKTCQGVFDGSSHLDCLIDTLDRSINGAQSIETDPALEEIYNSLWD